MKNHSSKITAKWNAVLAFLDTLPDPTIYCAFGDITNLSDLPGIYFFSGQHAEVIAAVGRTGWKRQLAPSGYCFDFQKVVNGVLVELTGAQPNVATPAFASEVDPEFFGPDAGLPAHVVRDVTQHALN